MAAAIDERTVGRLRRFEYQLGLRRALRAIEPLGSAEDEDPRSTPDAVAPERLHLAQAGILHLSAIVRQLVELWRGPEEDDFGRLRPTQDAFDRSVHLLVDAAIEGCRQQCPIPSGCASTDSEGGVRIEWVQPAASVHLVVPANKDQPPYLYHEVADDYATEDATPACLAYWLQGIG